MWPQRKARVPPERTGVVSSSSVLALYSGSGKTMLARRLPTILPSLTLSESLETTRIYSAMGRLKPDEPLLATRPFRAPHHTISDLLVTDGADASAPSVP